MENKSVIMPLEATIKEVHQQPDAVRAAINANRDTVGEIADLLIWKGIQKLFVIGSGDSLFAGMCVRQAFHDFAGVPLFFTQAYEYARHGEAAVGEDAALFVVSSSGRFSTTRDALDRALGSGAVVIGLTDNAAPDNPFYARPDKVLVPGGVKQGWPSQTTTAAIGVLLNLAVQLGMKNGRLSQTEAAALSNQLDGIPAMMGEILSEHARGMASAAERFVDANGIYFIGSGPGYGVANIGSAVMAEGPQKIGIPLYVEEFHHSLRRHTIKGGAPAFLIAPRDPAYDRYVDTAASLLDLDIYLIAIIDQDDDKIGQMANSAFRLPSVAYQMSPLLSLMPIHLFSLEVTKALIKRGYQRPCI